MVCQEMPLLTLDQVTVAFGHLALLESVSFQIDPGERIAMIGRNGAGKSTLLQVLAREVVPDTGSVWTPPAFRPGG